MYLKLLGNVGVRRHYSRHEGTYIPKGKDIKGIVWYSKENGPSQRNS